MRKHIFYLSVCILFLCCDSGSGGGSSSSKGSSSRGSYSYCEQYDQATLFIKNTSKNPYNIYSSGGKFYASVDGKSSKDFYVDASTSGFKAIQASGYVLYPTEVKITINMKTCGSYSWTIP